jgi:hypothetical protein
MACKHCLIHQALSSSLRAGGLLILLIGALSLRCDEVRAETNGFTRLFDGKTFAGWEGETNHTFRIEEGAIIGGSLKQPVPRNEFLCTTRYYTNFELRAKCRLAGDASANGGIQFRSRRVPHDSEVSGYQADMAEYQGDCWWGCLYDESRRSAMLARPDPAAAKKALKRGEWNDYRIRCEGRRIRLWLNGLPTVDFTEPDPAVENYGIIGLQIHRGAPSEAAYKDMVIQELP